MIQAANLTKNDLMQNYSISLAKINTDMRLGILPFVKVGRNSVRFSQADIQEYIKKY